jgi:hypothetical protein
VYLDDIILYIIYDNSFYKYNNLYYSESRTKNLVFVGSPNKLFKINRL